MYDRNALSQGRILIGLMEISMTKNIEIFLGQKSKRIQKEQYKPIIMNWLNSPSMGGCLGIIDKKVKYLIDNYQNGGENKLNQWLLSDDINFVTLTAERYIIDYLASKNSGFEDNLKKEGIDAVINYGNEKVGIEITTLNGFVGEWILTERLRDLLYEKGVVANNPVEITYNHERIIEETRQNRVYQYIEDASNAIQANDIVCLGDLDISIEIKDRGSGCILWNHSRAENFPWFKYLTGDLFCKLFKPKKLKQLSEYSKNIVFVGVNNIAPTNWAIPGIFEEIGYGWIRYQNEIEAINSFWSSKLKEYPNINGICYFCYSLDRETPFYPLRIFWRNETEKLSVNL